MNASKPIYRLSIELADRNSFDYPLRHKNVTLGRKSENAIVLCDEHVSGYHAEFRRRADGRFEVIDLNSQNGVMVNDRKVTRAVLQDGDRLVLGGVAILIREDNSATGGYPPSSHGGGMAYNGKNGVHGGNGIAVANDGKGFYLPDGVGAANYDGERSRRTKWVPEAFLQGYPGDSASSRSEDERGNETNGVEPEQGRVTGSASSGEVVSKATTDVDFSPHSEPEGGSSLIARRRGKLERLDCELDGRERALEVAEAKLKDVQRELGRADEKAAAMRQKQQVAAEELSQTMRQLAERKQSLTESESACEAARNELEVGHRGLEEMGRSHKAMKDRQAGLVEQMNQARREVKAREKVLESLHDTIDLKKHESKLLDEDRERFREARYAQEKGLEESRVELEKVTQDLSRRKAALKKLKLIAQEAERKRDEAGQQLKKVRRDHEDVVRLKDDGEEELRRITTEVEAKNKVLSALNSEIDHKKREFVNEDAAVREKMGESQRVLAAAVERQRGELEAITGRLKVREASLKAVESALDELERKRQEKEAPLEAGGKRRRVGEAQLHSAGDQSASIGENIEESERTLAMLNEEIQEKQRKAKVLQSANSLKRRAGNQERERVASGATKLGQLHRELDAVRKSIADSEAKVLEADERLALLNEEGDRQRIAGEENLSKVTRKIAERAEELAAMEAACREKKRELDCLEIGLRAQNDRVDADGDGPRGTPGDGGQKYAISETAAALREAGFTTIAVSHHRPAGLENAEEVSSEND